MNKKYDLWRVQAIFYGKKYGYLYHGQLLISLYKYYNGELFVYLCLRAPDSFVTQLNSSRDGKKLNN